MNIPSGYCQCGCGNKTNLVEKNCTFPFRIKGEPYKYLFGHHKNLDGPTVEDRFWAKVGVHGPDECWPWKGCINKRWGYGTFRYKRKDELAHRVLWMINVGPIPYGMKICHHCDNPPCCNPVHLFLGTHQDNMSDMVKKGRQPVNKGEKNPHSKLTETDVLNIRSSNLSPKELSSLYGINHKHAQRIKSGEYWGHL